VPAQRFSISAIRVALRRLVERYELVPPASNTSAEAAAAPASAAVARVPRVAGRVRLPTAPVRGAGRRHRVDDAEQARARAAAAVCGIRNHARGAVLR
jgi:hypothetical protein